MAATYSFLDTNVAISGPGGSFTIGGPGAGNADEGVTVSMIEEKNTMTIGADGQPMHNLHAGQGGKISIRLQKTSPVNAQLSAMYALQTASSALHGLNTITLKNPVSGDSVTGALCAFKKFPDLGYGKEGSANDWEFDVGILVPSLGNGGNAAAILAALSSNLPTGSV